MTFSNNQMRAIKLGYEREMSWTKSASRGSISRAKKNIMGRHEWHRDRKDLSPECKGILVHLVEYNKQRPAFVHQLHGST